MKNFCEICDRYEEMTFHHLIPRFLHSKKYYKNRYEKSYLKNHGIYVCKMCHKSIHKFFTEKELGLYYNTKNKLLSTKKVRIYREWAKKQK